MDYNTWNGKTVLDTEGNKVGSVGEIYVDDRTNQPAWMTVQSGLFGTKQNFVPLAGAQLEEDAVRVGFPKEIITSAPKVDVDEALSDEEERELYGHYQQAWEDGNTEGSNAEDTENDTVGHDTSGPTTDNAMTRSEERLNIDKEKEVIGRARLRKYVVTEHQTITVPVEREELRLDREPITEENRGDAMDGPEISEEEHEVVLSAERPVVSKETVPVERVRLNKETVQDQQEVESDVQKERIELENQDDDDPKRG